MLFYVTEPLGWRKYEAATARKPDYAQCRWRLWNELSNVKR